VIRRHSRQHLANRLVDAVGVAVALTLGVACALAQYQVNNRIGQVNTGMGPVNTRVGGELYGNNYNTGSVHYQTAYLPSEVRFAELRSGALPSELRMNAAAVGKLSPEGAVAYIPAQSELQKAVKAPAPALWGPAYGKRPEGGGNSGGGGGMPAPTPLAQPNMGTVRHAQAAGSSQYFITPQLTSAAGPISVAPVSPAAIPVSAAKPISYRAEDLFPAQQAPVLQPGSIRYSKPATQPGSLAP
jgi:hypothetical protein